MSIRQLPSPRWTVPGNSGAVAAGWYVYTYQPGTSTPKATYTDYTGTVENSNPISLDSRGEANIWWDGQYKVVVYTGDKDAGGTLVWSQDNYGEGTSSVLEGNFNLVLNGSFESDTNGDGVPDNWTIVEYTNGTVARDSVTQLHGKYSLKFTSIGTGGGYADSALFEVEESRVCPVRFVLKSSVAGVHNQVDIVWYTAAQAVISTTTLYNDSTTNPTSWTAFSYKPTPPSNARFALLRIYGCKDDIATAGSTWVDNVIVEALTTTNEFFSSVTGTVTATQTELNTLHGITSTTAELNKLHGATVTTTEINLLSGKTGTVWTSTNDGSGSGLDADKVDGKHASDLTTFVTAYDVTSSRALSTQYQNTTGKPMQLSVYVTVAAGQLLSGFFGPSSATMTALRLTNFDTSTAAICGSFIVPSGYYYEVVSAGGGTLGYWYETY